MQIQMRAVSPNGRHLLCLCGCRFRKHYYRGVLQCVLDEHYTDDGTANDGNKEEQRSGSGGIKAKSWDQAVSSKVSGGSFAGYAAAALKRLGLVEKLSVEELRAYGVKHETRRQQIAVTNYRSPSITLSPVRFAAAIYSGMW
jgi:hypothetical protein